MSIVNYYEVLGISPDANDEEIKAGYYNMLEVHKEEIAAEPQGLRWCFIQIGHDTLLDPAKREAHDAKIASSQTSVNSLVPAQTVTNTEKVQPRHQPQANHSSAVPQQPQVPQRPAPVQAPALTRHETPFQVPPRPTPQETPVSQNAGDSEGEDYLKHITKPVVDWSRMPWMQVNFSHLAESLQEAKKAANRSSLARFSKAVFTLGAMALVFFLVGVYASTFSLPQFKGFPVPAFLAVFVGISWARYYSRFWRKGRKIMYLVSIVLFAGASAASMMFGAEANSSSAVLAIFVVAVSLFIGWHGKKLVENKHQWGHSPVYDEKPLVKIPDQVILQTKVWGTAGDLSGATDKFGARNVTLGQAGELFTAELMEQILRIPGTRIFHGLQFPGSNNADVDHAIVNGNKVVFVDSKLWKAGDYSWNPDGTIVRRNGSSSTEIKSNFHAAIMGYHQRLPHLQMRSNILIHPASGKPMTIDNGKKLTGKRTKAPVTVMVTAQQFLEDTGAWFSEGTPGAIDKDLIHYLCSKLKL